MTYGLSPPYAVENAKVHIDQANKWEDSGGEGGVEDKGECVPEDVGWVSPGITWVNLSGSVILSYGHFHELGDVEDERNEGDGNNVDHHSHGAGHGLN